MSKLLFILPLLCPFFLSGQCPDPQHTDLVEIALEIKSGFGGEYWRDWTKIPFNVLLVTDQNEYVLNARSTDTTFQFGCDSIQFRPTSFSKQFLATFPLINWKPTIVVGTPENTGKSPEGWVVTLLHEHFHQLQMSRPDYQAAQEKLELSNGDNTSMWMLNYPYPYEQEEVGLLIKKMSQNLLSVYEDKPDYNSILQKHIEIKEELKELTGDKNHKYLNLQLWQEGYARFVEIRLLEKWILYLNKVDQKQFKFDQLIALRNKYHERIRKDLNLADFAYMKRDFLYSLGAAEAMLIEHTNPDWVKEYFSQLYDTDHLLK